MEIPTGNILLKGSFSVAAKQPLLYHINATVIMPQMTRSTLLTA